MSMRARLLAFLRVPAAPSAPAGDQDIRIFRAAPNFLRYKMVLWLLRQSGAAIGVLIGLRMLSWVPSIEIPNLGVSFYTIASVIEGFAIVGYVAQAVSSLALLRLDFDQRWYIVSDRSLRIREGILNLHEKTMTFANLQHVTIKQGPLERLLGIANVEVRTAGGGGSSKDELNQHRKDDMHVAYFRGVADAVGIRDTIRERLRRHVDAGLGDPDDEHRVAQLPSGSMLAAARALAEEARAYRTTVTREYAPNSLEKTQKHGF